MNDSVLEPVPKLRVAVIDDEAVIGVSCRRAWAPPDMRSSISAIRTPG